ncbi:MAG: tetratricopeptide repeat protein [Proteobacteria bacterium]|nr:tetratricopeptide repeat protein [Pseudomonadota bacterium]
MSQQVTAENTPNTKEDWFKRGVGFFQKHDFEKATHYFEEAIKIDNEYLPAICGKGNCLATLQRFDDANSYFKQALEYDSKCVDAINGQANIFYSIGELDAAMQSFNRIIDINPDYGLAWYGKGSILAQKNDPEQALICFDKVLALDEKHVPSLNGRGNVLIQQNKTEEALNCYHKILEIDPGNSMAWFNRGSLLFDYQQYAESKASMNRSYLHHNPVEFQTFALPFFKNFVERFHSPALLYRVLWNDFPHLISQEHIQPIAQNVFENYADLADIINFSRTSEGGLSEMEWYFLAAFISLFHGDPILSSELIGEVAENNLTELHLQYILLLSLDGILETKEEYENSVYKYLDSLNPEELNSKMCYYGGQLYFRKGDLDKALLYFETTMKKNSENKLASHFMQYYCAHLKEDESQKRDLFRNILTIEKELYHQGKFGFLNTEKLIQIDLKKKGWEQSFFRYGAILEISGALILFQAKLKDKDIVDQLQIEDPNFDYAVFTDVKLRQGTDKWWELTESSKETLNLFAVNKKKVKIQTLQDEMKVAYELEKFAHPSGLPLPEIEILMKEEIKKDPKNVKELHFAVQIGYLKGHIPLQESLLLIYYSLYLYYSSTMEPDGISNKTFMFKEGLKKGFENFLSSLPKLMTVHDLPAHKMFYDFSMINGISRSFYEAFFTSDNPSIPDNIETLQFQYSRFIQDQKEKLGGEFFEKYSIFDINLPLESVDLSEGANESEKIHNLVSILGRTAQITKRYEEAAELVYDLLEKTPEETTKEVVGILKRTNPVFAKEIEEDYLS